MNTLKNIIVIAGLMMVGQRFLPSGASLVQPGCDIKGNVSYNGERRLYHIPGMQNYQETVISPGRGERWFCSEEEAIASGWTKAPR